MTTSQDWERRRNRWAEYKAQQEGNTMRHDETRDNCTNLEATLIAADAFEETREDEGSDGTTWHECGCEDCSTVPVCEHGGRPVTWFPSLGSEVQAEHMAEFYG